MRRVALFIVLLVATCVVDAGTSRAAEQEGFQKQSRAWDYPEAKFLNTLSSVNESYFSFSTTTDDLDKVLKYYGEKLGRDKKWTKGTASNYSLGGDGRGNDILIGHDSYQPKEGEKEQKPRNVSLNVGQLHAKTFTVTVIVYYPGMKPAQPVLGATKTRNPKTETDHVHPITRRPPVVG
jgi:hypothetical protein